MMDFALNVLALLAGGYALQLYSAAWAGGQSEPGSLRGAETQPKVTDFRND
jgi:hypothetical protein